MTATSTLSATLDPRRASPTERQRATTAAFVVLAAAASAFILAKGRGNTFFYDDWTWLTSRANGLHSILASYNQHIVAVPVALFQVLYRVVGLQHFWVYRVIGVVVHVACASVLFVYARRRLGGAALLLVLPILFLGYAWEYVLWPINVGFIGSIGLSVGALLALESERPRAGWLACALFVVALACSEFTIPFVVAAGLELCWRDRSPRRAYVWLIPLIIYGVWWLHYHQASPWRDNVTAAPSYAGDLAASAVGGLFGLDIDWGRPLLLAGAGLLIFALSRGRRVTPRLAAVLVAAGLFWILVALGRAQLGDPTASRYIYTGAILVALIIAETARGMRVSPLALVVLALAAIISLAGNIRQLDNGEGEFRQGATTVTAELGALRVAGHAAPAALLIDQHFMPGITAAAYDAAVREFGPGPGKSETQLTTDVEYARTAADGLLFRAGELRIAPGAGAPATSGCQTLHAAQNGSTFGVQLPAAGLYVSVAPGPSVALRARRFASGFDGDPIATVAGGGAVTIRPAADSSARPWEIGLSPSQNVRACPLG